MSPCSIWFCFANNKTLESSHCAGSWHSLGGWKGLEGLRKERLAWILDNDITTVDAKLTTVPAAYFIWHWWVNEYLNFIVRAFVFLSSVTFVIFFFDFIFFRSPPNHKYFHKGKLICLAKWSPWLSSYLIFVIFFTRAKFLENKIYTKKRQFFALNL